LRKKPRIESLFISFTIELEEKMNKRSILSFDRKSSSYYYYVMFNIIKVLQECKGVGDEGGGKGNGNDDEGKEGE